MPAKETPRPAVAARPHRAPAPRPVPRVAPHALASLQRSAGNAAVTLAVQRLAGAPASPKQDSRFLAVTAKVKQQSAKLKTHPPAQAEAKKAQDAAVAPPDERDAKAKATVADEMATAKPGGFDKAAFIAAVKQAIAAQTPKNLDEADKFAESGKADNVKAQVAGKVTEGKQTSAKDIADKTAKPPDPSAVPPKPVTPMAPERPAAPSPIEAGKAMPARAPPAATDLSAPKAETDQKMAEAGVTEEQLAKSNEPEFTGALAAKKEGEQHSATAPGPVRAKEASTLAGSAQAAKATGATGVAAMASARNTRTGQVTTGKDATKTRDETKRAEFTAHVKGIFDATKRDVEVILNGLDAEVGRRFDTGEKAARDAFTADHKARMARYKDARYSGIEGAARWAADLILSLPPEANQIYVESKKLYESRMERVISDVADYIGTQLTAAKTRIATGQAEIKKFVASQPKDLQKIAQEAADGFQAQFAQLESDVESKQQGLVDDLASRYVAARNAVDEEINALKEANKGLWDKAKDAVGGAIETITKLKDMLLGVLARAAGAIEKIIKDPIGFLGNFVNAVKAGIAGFAANIVEHLKKGLQAWLLGALAEGGIEIPEKFDLKGIVKLILSILGLTWANIRARIVKQIPERVMGALEKAVDFIQVILGEGIGGLWKFVAAKLTDLKEMVLGKIREFVITKVITAGITWLISMLNPAAAFIKACKMIYDVVMFFVEKAAQIKEFVDSVLDSVESIAGGGVGAVAGLIEKTLAKMVPVLIGFLASLLGLGGISEKIKSILAAIQKPVMSVVDKLVAGAIKLGKKLWGKLTGKGKPDNRSPEEKKAALDAAMRDGQVVLEDSRLTESQMRARLASIKTQHRVKALDLVVDNTNAASKTVHVAGENSPPVKGPPVTISVGGQDVGVWQVDDKRIRVTFDVDDPGAVVRADASPARLLEGIMSGLEMDRVTAQELVDALAAKGVVKSAAEVRPLLHAYARTEKAGGMDPVEFLRGKVRLGHSTAAAFRTPPSSFERRQAGVELGKDEEGKQRATLSNFAQVFYEKKTGQWTSRQVQKNPEQGENTSIEYVWHDKDTTPTVVSLGIVEIDESGVVVTIVEATREVPGGVSELAEIMAKQGWTVRLRR